MVTVHEETYKTLLILRALATKPEVYLPELIDCCFVVKEISRLADDLRKELNGVIKSIAKTMCTQFLSQMENINNPEDPTPLRGQLATGSPKVRRMASIPNMRSDPENYMKLMKALGFTEDAVKMNIARIHFPTLTKLVIERDENGVALPPGLENATLYPEYSVMLRGRKGIDLKDPQSFPEHLRS